MAGILKRYTSLTGAIDMLMNNRLALLSPKTWQDRNDTRFLETFCDKTDYRSVFAACFTRAPETYHHWDGFARHNEGVCVHFDSEALLTPLKDRPNYYWRDMKYVRLNRLADMGTISVYDLPFMKRYGYKAEEEFRLIYASKAESVSHYIEIERPMVKKIIINPWAPAPVVPALKSLLKSIPGWKTVPVNKSSLIDNSQWEAACRRVDDFEFFLDGAPENVID